MQLQTFVVATAADQLDIKGCIHAAFLAATNLYHGHAFLLFWRPLLKVSTRGT